MFAVGETNVAGRLMTQDQMSFWHPFSFESKRLAYRPWSQVNRFTVFSALSSFNRTPVSPSRNASPIR